MKAILIPTDFSDNATRAAECGYMLAKQLKANVILFNAFTIPVDTPQAAIVMWPMYEHDEMPQSCNDFLHALQQHLEVMDTTGFMPVIQCIGKAGSMGETIGDVMSEHEIGLVVMGTHGGSGLSGLLLGNHARHMIDDTKYPLLLIPPYDNLRPIKKIAFASDHQNLIDDLDSIYELIEMAKYLFADIVLSFVSDEKTHTAEFEKYLKDLLVELSNKADYPHIYYRLIKNGSVERGLEWLCEHGGIDMLAMVHRPHSFTSQLVKGSHTKKMADRITLPLLVFPAKGGK